MQGRRAARQPAHGRGGRRGLVIAAALALLLVFAAVRFPYARLLPPLLDTARAATGAEIEVGDLGLGLGLAGPHVVARDVRLRWPTAPELRFEAVRVRPAWSLAWLSGTPRWHVDAAGAPGSFRGEVAAGRVAGEWRDVDTAALPWALAGTLAPLSGRVSGEVDLAHADGAWQGSAALTGQDGSVDLPGLPVAIPFVAIAAQLEVTPARVELSSARIEGPLVTANVAGTATASGAAISAWPLDLAVEIESVDPALRGYLGPLGIQEGGNGRAHVRVTGTLAAPYLSGTTQ
jgi:type II secretion system protein N